MKTKFVLLLLLVVLPFYIGTNLYVIDQHYFLNPITCEWDFLIRNDSRGKGFFGAPRSGNRTHQGLDLLAEVGTSVLAARSGRVISARRRKGMGNFVIIRHNTHIVTLYGHLSRIDVSEGEYVRQGDCIGAIGKTGNANYRAIKPHLHFEVRINDRAVDPMDLLK